MIDIDPNNFDTIDEYYEAREESIMDNLVNNKELDFEDYDYILNNFWFFLEDVIGFTYNNEIYFFKLPESSGLSSNYKFERVKPVPKTVYVWEEY